MTISLDCLVVVSKFQIRASRFTVMYCLNYIREIMLNLYVHFDVIEEKRSRQYILFRRTQYMLWKLCLF